jgi:hypothetical protein
MVTNRIGQSNDWYTVESRYNVHPIQRTPHYNVHLGEIWLALGKFVENDPPIQRTPDITYSKYNVQSWPAPTIVNLNKFTPNTTYTQYKKQNVWFRRRFLWQKFVRIFTFRMAKNANFY